MSGSNPWTQAATVRDNEREWLESRLLIILRLVSAPNFSIPDHELIRLIGRGSYGEVWLARSALGTLRAAKVVRKASFDSERPFLREFTGIQKFEPISRSHEALVDILQVGLNSAEGYLYYVMELADDATAAESGEKHWTAETYEPRTLASEVAKYGPMPVDKAVRLFVNLASCIGHLHRRGLLHRDIKPSNVIFVAGQPKLADIGLVTEADGTRTFVGTEGFIPPEGPGTVSADLYALGKLMYEVVTGKDRHDFPSLPMHRDDPERDRALLELNVVLLKCCEPDLKRRYASADALQADLLILQSGQSIQRLQAFERRLRATRRVALATAALTLLAVAGVFFERRRERVAEENLQASERLRIRAERAEREAGERLYSTLIAQASAERRSGMAGARANALAALRQAVEIHPMTAEIRTEFIAALALPDFPIRRRWSTSPADYPVRWPSAALDAEATLVASVQTNGSVAVRRVSDDGLVHTLSRAGVPLRSVGPFSPGAEYLITRYVDDKMAVWRMADGAQVLLAYNDGRMHNAQFIDHARRVTVVTKGDLSVYDLASGSRRIVPIPQVKRVNVAPDARKVAASTMTGSRVEIWDVDTALKTDEFKLDSDSQAWAMAWSPDGRRLAVGTTSHRVEVWGRGETNWVREASFKGHGAEVTHLEWSPTGDVIVSAGWDDTVRLWGLKERREIARQPSGFVRFQFSEDGRRLAMLEAQGPGVALAEVNYEDYFRVAHEPGPENVKSPYQVEFTDDSRWLLAATAGGVRAYDPRTGRETALLKTPGSFELSTIPGDQRHFILSGEGNNSRLVECSSNATGGLDLVDRGSIAPVNIAAMQPSGITLGAAGTNMAVYYADGHSVVLNDTSKLYDIKSSADGRYVVATPWLRAVYWRMGAVPEFHDLGPARHFATAFSPDSKALFYANDGDLVRVDPATGARSWRVRLTDRFTHTGTIRVMPDGRRVGAVMDRFSVSIVDAATGALWAILEPPDPQFINSFAFSPDGSMVAAACSTHVIYLWDLRRIEAEIGQVLADRSSRQERSR
jgi:WD40 repeat protein